MGTESEILLIWIPKVHGELELLEADMLSQDLMI